MSNTMLGAPRREDSRDWIETPQLALAMRRAVNVITQFGISALALAWSACPAIAQAPQDDGYLYDAPTASAPDPYSARREVDRWIQAALESHFEPWLRNANAAAVEIEGEGTVAIPITAVGVGFQNKKQVVLERSANGQYQLHLQAQGQLGAGVGLSGIAYAEAGVQARVMTSLTANPTTPGQLAALVTFVSLGMDQPRYMIAERILKALPAEQFQGLATAIGVKVRDVASAASSGVGNVQDAVNPAGKTEGPRAAASKGLGFLKGVLDQISGNANAISALATAMQELPPLTDLITRIRTDSGVYAKAEVDVEVAAVEGEVSDMVGLDAQIRDREYWLTRRVSAKIKGSLPTSGGELACVVEVRLNPATGAAKLVLEGASDVMAGLVHVPGLIADAGVSGRTQITLELDPGKIRHLMSPEGIRLVAREVKHLLDSIPEDDNVHIEDAIKTLLPVKSIAVDRALGIFTELGADANLACVKVKTTVLAVRSETTDLASIFTEP